MSNFSAHIIHSLIVGSALIFGTGCKTDSAKRPSPLTSDTTIIGGKKVYVVYSSPAVKDRKIWDALVPYNEVWRTGANEATYLCTETALLVADQPLSKGSYAIFTIPTDSSWTVIFNKEWDQWGAYNYDSTKDEFRIQVNPAKSDFHERMTFDLEQDKLLFNWENLSYELKLQAQN